MTVQELLRSGKRAISNSDELSELFSYYFSEHFKGATASFCCTFSDFDKLRNRIFIKNNNDMTLKKYKVNLKPNDILFYVENKVVHRSYVRRLTDSFLDKFMELHDPKRFGNIIDKIEVLDSDEVELAKVDLTEVKDEAINKAVSSFTAKEVIALIQTATLEGLEQYKDDTRVTVQRALEERLNELKKDE